MTTEMTGECKLPKETEIFSRGELIGAGSFAHVYKACCRVNNTICALKSFHMKRKDGDQFLIAVTEAAFVRLLQHPNIIDYVNCEIKREYVFLGVEYTSLGCLLNIMRYGGLSEVNIQTVMKQLLSALCYLHSRFIFHGDVKPDNVLLVDYGTKINKIKLCDFGLTQIQLPTKECRRQIGSFFYMSPEIHLGFPSDYRSDLYSAGVLMYELMYGRKPFMSTNITREQYLIMLRKRFPIQFPATEAKYSTQCFDLVKNLLSYDKHERLKTEIRHDTYLNIPAIKCSENHYIKACEFVISSVDAINKEDLGKGYLDIIEAMLHLKIHMNIIQVDEGQLKYVMSNYKRYLDYSEKIQLRIVTNIYSEPLTISSKDERIRCILESTPALLTGFDICSIAEIYYFEENYTKSEELFHQGLEILFNNLNFEPEGIRKNALLSKMNDWLLHLEDSKAKKDILPLGQNSLL